MIDTITKPDTRKIVLDEFKQAVLRFDLAVTKNDVHASGLAREAMQNAFAAEFDRATENDHLAVQRFQVIEAMNTKLARKEDERLSAVTDRLVKVDAVEQLALAMLKAVGREQACEKCETLTSALEEARDELNNAASLCDEIDADSIRETIALAIRDAADEIAKDSITDDDLPDGNDLRNMAKAISNLID